MQNSDALLKLRQHRDELSRLGVAQLYLYGSVARDAASSNSDVDLLITPNHASFSLFDLMDVQDACTRILGRAADIHDYRGLARVPAFQASIQSDLINVF